MRFLAEFLKSRLALKFVKPVERRSQPENERETGEKNESTRK